jgi:hypothetical protein
MWAASRDRIAPEVSRANTLLRRIARSADERPPARFSCTTKRGKLKVGRATAARGGRRAEQGARR